MARSIDARIDDMCEAIRGIRQMLEGKGFEDYEASWALQRATERGLEIISEASRAIPDSLKMTRPEVPWAHIAAIGNVLRHEYQRVEPLIVWNITLDHLAGLEAALDAFRKA